MSTLFSEEHYKKTIVEYGYNEVEFSPIRFSLGMLDTRTLSARWLCHNSCERFAQRFVETGQGTVTTGFGMSGVPHLGSVSQVLAMVALQQAGISTQIVLGDLDAYNARRQGLETVIKRAKIFRRFIISLGYDERMGILRDQYSQLETLREAFLYSRYLLDEDFLNTEEDLGSLYETMGIYSGITFPVKQAILLMITDFLTLARAQENVVVMLGIDEHRYVRLASRLSSQLYPATVFGALYTRINRGLKGFPKMSKSIPESSIHLEMPKDNIRTAILNDPDLEENAENSALIQLLISLGLVSSSDLEHLVICRRNQDSIWSNAKHHLVDFICELTEKWKNAAGEGGP